MVYLRFERDEIVDGKLGSVERLINLGGASIDIDIHGLLAVVVPTIASNELDSLLSEMGNSKLTGYSLDKEGPSISVAGMGVLRVKEVSKPTVKPDRVKFKRSKNKSKSGWVW